MALEEQAAVAQQRFQGPAQVAFLGVAEERQRFGLQAVEIEQRLAGGVRRADRHQLFVAKLQALELGFAVDAQAARHRLAFVEQRHHVVHRAVAQARQALRQVIAVDAELGAAEVRLQARNPVREEHRGEDVRGAETNAPLGVFVALADRLAQVVQGAHRVLRHALQLAAGLGQFEGVLVALEDRRAEPLFQGLDTPAEPGHGDMALLRRTAEALDPTEDEEVLEHHQVDHRCAFLNGRAFSVYFARRCLLQG